MKIYDIEKQFEEHCRKEALRLFRAEIERQNIVAISDKHDKYCACWCCIGRLQAWIIETRRPREEETDG